MYAEIIEHDDNKACKNKKQNLISILLTLQKYKTIDI